MQPNTRIITNAAEHQEAVMCGDPHITVEGEIRGMPMLDVRDELGFDPSLIVADGYHRPCASHPCNEDADVLCRTDGDSQ